MAFSWSELNYPAGTTSVPVDIAYLDKSYIYVYLDNVLTTDYTWASDTVIQFNTALAAATDVLLVRRTDKEFLYIMFAEGAAFIRENIDTQNTQFLHLAQELTEGRSIEGFYGDLSMNGFRITNLGDGVNPGDAVNKGQLDKVDERVGSLEQSFIQDTTSYPWYTVTTAATDTFSPPYTFTKAALYINGVCQVPGYSYEVVSNQILLADPVPIGTLVFARLGEDVGTGESYATADQLAAVATSLQATIDTKLDADANAVSATKLATARALQTDLASDSSASFDGTGDATLGVTGVLPLANGGTGNMTGLAATATALATARTFQTDLASAGAVGFDGTANVTPGVTGTLGLANGGTGATTAAAARTALGAATRGSNADITALTGLTGGVSGITSAAAAADGVVGQVLTATSSGAVTMTSGTASNLVSLVLPAGVWLLEGSVRLDSSGATITSRTCSINEVSATSPTNWYDSYNDQATTAAGVNVYAVPSRYYNVSASTTVYAVAVATSTGTLSGRGYIRAIRIR